MKKTTNGNQNKNFSGSLDELLKAARKASEITVQGRERNITGAEAVNDPVPGSSLTKDANSLEINKKLQLNNLPAAKRQEYYHLKQLLRNKRLAKLKNTTHSGTSIKGSTSESTVPPAEDVLKEPVKAGSLGQGASEEKGQQTLNRQSAVTKRLGKLESALLELRQAEREEESLLGNITSQVAKRKVELKVAEKNIQNFRRQLSAAEKFAASNVQQIERLNSEAQKVQGRLDDIRVKTGRLNRANMLLRKKVDAEKHQDGVPRVHPSSLGTGCIVNNKETPNNAPQLLKLTVPHTLNGTPPSRLYSSSLKVFHSYRLNPYFRLKEKLTLVSRSFTHKVNPEWIVCRFDLTGKCNDDVCSWQHLANATMNHSEVIQDLVSYCPEISGIDKSTKLGTYPKLIGAYVDSFQKKNTLVDHESQCVLMVSSVNEAAGNVPPHTTLLTDRRWRPGTLQKRMDCEGLTEDAAAVNGLS